MNSPWHREYFYYQRARSKNIRLCQRSSTMILVIIFLLAFGAKALQNPPGRSQMNPPQSLRATTPTHHAQHHQYLKSKTESKISLLELLYTTSYEQDSSSMGATFLKLTSTWANPMPACYPTHAREIRVCSFGTFPPTTSMLRMRYVLLAGPCL